MKQKMTVTFLNGMIQTIVINGEVLDGPDMYEALYSKTVFIPIEENGVKDFVIDYPEVLTPAKLAEEISSDNITCDDIHELQHPSDLIDCNLNDYLSDVSNYKYWFFGSFLFVFTILMVSTIEIQSIALATLVASAVSVYTLRVLIYFGFVYRIYLLKNNIEVQVLLAWVGLLIPSLFIAKVVGYV